jgi:hypothetical protein
VALELICVSDTYGSGKIILLLNPPTPTVSPPVLFGVELTGLPKLTGPERYPLYLSPLLGALINSAKSPFNDEPNEYGICHCLCSNCGKYLNMCRYICWDGSGNINELYSIVKLNDKRFAMLKTDKKILIEKLNVWINLYKIENDSKPGNIIMSHSGINNPCGIFNSVTKKVRLFN